MTDYITIISADYSREILQRCFREKKVIHFENCAYICDNMWSDTTYSENGLAFRLRKVDVVEKPITEHVDISVQLEKPPLGVMPRKIHREKRIDDLLHAIGRYSKDNRVPPIQWVDELRDLMEEIG